MKKHLIYWLAAFVIVMVGCQKELSFEGSNTPAEGSLQSDVTGDCLPKTVNGTYVSGTALVPATNTITVQVNVVKTGTYVVTTDTVNGFYFRAASTFTTLGATTVTLRGNGTPFAAGVNNFVVSFDSTFCDIQVTVIAPLPPGVGSLAGSPNACAPITVNGGYSPGVAFTSGNNVVVQVNVTTAGNFNITTDTVAGMWFTFTGGLALSPPPQNVTLQAQGSIPAATTPGLKTFKVKLGTSQCTFDVTVAGPAVYTIDCPNVTVNGTYQVGVPLNPAFHIITIPVTVTTPGPYSITVSTNGMTFTGSGNLTGASGSITLTGLNSTSPAGPPGVYPLTVGTCSIPITVVAAPVINWKFNIGTNVYQGVTVPGSVIFDPSVPPFTDFEYEGDNVSLDDIQFQLIDLAGGITANETYNSNSTGSSNIAFFYFTDGGGNVDLAADFQEAGVNMVFKITSHNVATKTIVGTFSGTAHDYVSGSTKTITSGTFTAVYP
jgi:hypothetical protein